MSASYGIEEALNGASRFALFLSRAIPKLQEWWNEHRDRKLEEQLDALDVALGRSFERAREELSAKYPDKTAPVLSMAGTAPLAPEGTGGGATLPPSGAEGGAQ